MPSSRRLKATGLLALLTVLVIFYVSHGASSTRNSPFYTRTVAAMNERESSQARNSVLAEEKRRVEQLQREHRVAMDAAKPEAAPPTVPTPDTDLGDRNPYDQKPIAPGAASGRPVAGRKMMADGKVVESNKANGDDGVAKVGNVGPSASHNAVKGETEEEKEKREIEATLNDILRKGPIIVFSKSYCPYSKKAKRILLDLYSITPPPYVVELDQHPLGDGLQSALATMTGRRTVPNVLVNGRSIGGGDDIEELHEDDKLTSTLYSMGGKRVTKIVKHDLDKRSEMRFKA